MAPLGAGEVKVAQHNIDHITLWCAKWSQKMLTVISYPVGVFCSMTWLPLSLSYDKSGFNEKAEDIQTYTEKKVPQFLHIQTQHCYLT